MAVKTNLLASYASQIYSSLIGILILPLYIDYMGAEAYGLVGFFTMLAAWFTLLDMGLTATVMRESARYGGGSCSSSEYVSFIRSFSFLFLLVASVIFAGVWFSADSLARNWLNLEELSDTEVSICISIMGAIIALRWLGGLFRGVVNGAERIVMLSAINASFATLRFVVVLPVIVFVSAEPVAYFSFQLIVALVEFFTLLFASSLVVPGKSSLFSFKSGLSFKPIKSSITFSLSVAFTSVVWVVITQTDKLILSKLMNLSDYGYYSLAVLAASGILVLSGPISSVLMPRLANLEAQGKQKEFLSTYRSSTQFASVISASLAFLLFFFAEELLWVWTGNENVVRNAADILRVYALGNGVLVVSAFPYYMQFAKGDMKMHLYGNILFLAVLLPLVIWAAHNHGAIGAAWVWFGSNLVLFMCWLPLVHRRFYDKLNRRWFFNDTTLIFVTIGCVYFLFSLVEINTDNRALLLFYVTVVALASMLAGCFTSSKLRSAVESWKFKWKG